jgi:type II secretory pathway component PulJ
MWRATNHFKQMRRKRAAFSVAELMLAVAIMGVIIFALYSVFNQTQKALRSTETQGDVAEKARAIVDIISRELEQAQATFSAARVGTNVYNEINILGGFEYGPLIQRADRVDIQPRTNFLHKLFFYTNHTNAWQAIGYRVVDVTNGVGVLQRFQTNQFGYRPLNNRLASAFINETVTNRSFHHVADGVIHMAFIPYDSRGYRLGYDTTNRTPGTYQIYRSAKGGFNATTSDVAQTNLATVLLYQGDPNARAETLQYATSFAFKSNAMPAYIEMEFGILEPETLTQYYLMKKEENPNADKFLQRQVSKVHLFRQRIPIRTAAQ